MDVRAHILANDFSVVIQLVIRGAGIGQIPTWVASDALRSGEFVRVLEHYAPPPIGVYAVYPTRRHLSTKVRTFLDHLVPRFSRPPWVEAMPEGSGSGSGGA